MPSNHDGGSTPQDAIVGALSPLSVPPLHGLAVRHCRAPERGGAVSCSDGLTAINCKREPVAFYALSAIEPRHLAMTLEMTTRCSSSRTTLRTGVIR